MSEPTKDTGSNQSSPTASSGDRRRSSSGFMPAFESLQQHRRESNVARRQSMSDQHVKGNFISQFFHNNFGKNA